LENKGAELKGEFTRTIYNKWNLKTAGKNALKSLSAELPYSAKGVWYRDEIGNISTSHAWKDVNLSNY